MKFSTKLAFIATAVVAFGSSTAFADDPQLQTRIAAQRQAAERDKQSTTVAVYAGGHVGHRHMMQNQRSATRFEVRSNAHGQTYGVFVRDAR